MLIVALFSCEEVVIIDLPPEQNLLVVEGWVTDKVETQYVRLSRSNSFLGDPNPIIADAIVTVQQRNGNAQTYSYSGDGFYFSDSPFAGEKDQEYRVNLVLANGELIRSDWDKMQASTEIILLSIDNFDDNDPENPNQTKTFFFPRITALDSSNFDNYYRWVFYRNDVRVVEPESITLQNDLFFDGNFIPNLFDSFEFEAEDEVKVELQSITEETFDYLNLLKAQITTLGAAASTTPAIVNGNIFNVSNPDETILGYFGTRAISLDSAIAR